MVGKLDFLFPVYFVRGGVGLDRRGGADMSIGEVKLSPQFQNATRTADYLAGLAGNLDALEKNFPLVPPDFRNYVLCSVCFGAGLLPARFAVYEASKEKKPIAYVDTKVVCAECNGKGEK